MKFYASKCHDRLNGSVFNPESVADAIMMNPNYSQVSVPVGYPYMLDSGAFQDVATEKRLSFKDALDRQLLFEKKMGSQAESIVSYDRLIDEQVENGKQFKCRVDTATGEQYVEETIQAAEYLAHALPDRQLVLSNQGTTVDQYVTCVENILRVAKPTDIIGIGGFCILSKSKKYKEDYFAIMKLILPKIKEKGVSRIHIFGMSVFEVLIRTEIMCAEYGISPSYDTSSTELNSVFGRVFDPIDGMIHNVFKKEEKHNGYEPAGLSLLNIKNVTDFWHNMDMIKWREKP